MPPDISGLPASTPTAEVEIDVSRAQDLLRAQFPDLANLSIEHVDSGWDNVIFRLGDNFALRFPRRELAAKLVEHEQRWLPELAPRLPVPIPAPLHMGKPANGYPWRWSILPWLTGAPADQSELTDDGTLPAFLTALHVTAPEDAPKNQSRGVPLRQRAEAVETRMQRLKETTALLSDNVLSIWKTALAAPIDCPATWIHGDLHARNVLVENGRISSVIDWGDIAAGDRATDLAAIWTLLPSAADRQQAIDACGPVSEATWQRARGWAVLFGVILLDTGLTDHPRHAAMGEQILRRVSKGP